MDDKEPSVRQEIDHEREALLQRLQDWLEVPMVVLAFIWLALFVIEVLWGLMPLLSFAGYVIWSAFILEFALGSVLAPYKTDYLKRNWLKGLSVLAPALRIFRVLSLLRLAHLSRAARVARGLRLLRLLSSVNRGMRALGATMKRRGFAYVAALTLIVGLAGAAGMYAFERDLPGGRGLGSYAEALWWTGMLLTTMGSDYWPHTPEGRVLCFALALYSLGVLGYVTAVLATFFIGRDAEDDTAEVAGANAVDALRAEIAALRQEIVQRN
jgi:voltage-gated potassium channel